MKLPEQLFPVETVDEPSPSAPAEARQALANLVAALAAVPITGFNRPLYDALHAARRLLAAEETTPAEDQ